MRWVLYFLAAFVELSILYYFFVEFRGVGRVCANCSTKYKPSAGRCPHCGVGNPNESDEW